MRHLHRLFAVAIFAGILLSSLTTSAKPHEGEDRTLSPYFFVKSDDPGVDRLPLKSHSVKADISGVIADVLVTQTYRNEGKRPLEAVYTFPASTRAAVYGMKMTIGERTITADIEEREKARRDYEQAKQAGKSASLLEQQRPNVFQMNVANILPSDVIKVELRYTELLVPNDAVYEFMYPTVVGPRYSNQSADQAPAREKWVENPYLHQGESPTYTFHMEVNLSAGLPIQEITCPSHKVDIAYEGASFSSIQLDPADKFGGNRDFMLRYRLAGRRIQTGLLLYEGEKENFFLAMLQPPKRVTPEQIPPREYIFIVDVSGSMNGFPLNISKKLLKDLISNLRPTDRFNVLLFAGSSSLMAQQSLPATPENVHRAMTLIERQRGGGGTELLPALKRALALPGAKGASRSVVIATDGYVTVEEEAFDLIRNSLGEANMFAFGIGSSVNRHLIEGMARVGMGEPFVITRPDEAPEKADKFRELIESPVLTEVEIDFGGFETYDVEPKYIPDVLAQRPVIVFGKWRGNPEGIIELKGTSGKQSFRQTIDVAAVKPFADHAALRYLWARHRIALLSDYNTLNPRNERVQEITNLGLTYNLLTAYTSFVAIDTRIRLKGDKAETVKQPLPLPQGVSDLAVGRGGALRKMALAPSAPMVSGVSKGKVADGNLRVIEESECVDSEMHSEGYKGLHLQVENITVSEGLSERQVRTVIQKLLPTLDTCFSHAPNGDRQGKAVFTLIIGLDGRVDRVITGKIVFNDKILERCMVRHLKTLQFPAPTGHKMVKISATFTVK